MATQNTIEKILEFAIANEQEAFEFYEKLANEADSQEMKEVFKTFALEEMGHKKRLQEVKQEKRMVIEKHQPQDLKLSDYLVDVKPNPKMTYQEALIVAMKKEKAAYQLYCDIAKRFADTTMKEIFLALAREEANHKLRFELEYDEVALREN